jgi:mono/diheme cytochrome c family protein
MSQRRGTWAWIGAAVFTALAATGAAQHSHGDAAKPSPPPPPGSRRITMDDLHRSGGVPRGWKFTLPIGDATRGKQVFADLECFTCHQIDGAGFPPPGADGKVGPPLTGAGRQHPAEYFAEAILSPNSILVDGPGFIGPDGRSIMPEFADSLSVTQLLDLVAFLKSQVTGHEDHEEAAISRESTAGPYRVRLVFDPGNHGAAARGGHAHQGTSSAAAGSKPGAGGHAAHAGHSASAGQGAHAGHGADTGHGAHAERPATTSQAGPGHLMVFVSDATTGEAIPYVPVSAAVHAPGTAARTVKLAPMLGPEGFHYGADTTLPASIRRVVVSVGTPTVRVTGEERTRYAKPHSVTFEWITPAK